MTARNDARSAHAVRESSRHVPFGFLQAQVTRLEAFSVIFIGVILCLPPSIFFGIEISHLRSNAQRLASHFARAITMHVEKSGFNVQAISPLLEKEMQSNSIVSIQLIGAANTEIMRVRDPGGSWFEIEVGASFTPSTAPLKELRLSIDDRPLLYQTARVFGIHLLIAILVGLAIHWMGIRPLHRAIEELETMQAQLIHSEKLATIGEIYAGLTHEINNPLAIILSRVSLLVRAVKESRLPADLLPDLEMIDRHGNRIAETIRGLLQFARRSSFDLSGTDLNQVINETVTLVEKSFARDHIQIQCHLAPDLPKILGSPDHLQQVFVNLLNNARDAMAKGGLIKLQTYRNSVLVVAEVEDSGAGIPEDLKGRIFEPFFTTKSIGKGTGLGLSVSYGIIRAHGGDIEVESSPGQGALFRVILPIADKHV
ncbi:MAG: hypothetical protein HY695_02120 [Deltaproteobacteria bacterium]|nr:hypothetical protein [Deltaproteobacteria bacterium]